MSIWGYLAAARRRTLVCFSSAMLALAQCPSFGEGKYLALPLANGAGKASAGMLVDRSGIPFREGTLAIASGGSARVALGGRAKRIFLLGMTHSGKPHAWPDPRNYSSRFFVGDELGRIRLEYADGSEQVFPLILGESIWWGPLFYEYPQPFPTDEPLRRALAGALRLYPPAPVADGDYLAVIVPKPDPIRSIVVEDFSAKSGVPLIAGITVEAAEGAEIAGAVALPGGAPAPEMERFIAEKSLRPSGADEDGARLRLGELRRALYSSDEDFRGHVPAAMPPGYSGPTVSFKGTIFAEILANAFHRNLADLAAKVGADGAYHTSTKDSISWGSYSGFGTFADDVGKYYGQSYSRDMGRSLQELTELGYLDAAARCADYCLRMARVWEEKPSLKLKDQFIPRHWGQVINRAGRGGCFENDGHGLTTLFLYKLWQRLPNRDEWLRSRWVDVKGAGDWILWQFDHPAISGATDVLRTTGESAGGNGAGGGTVYADAVCMHALEGLARMADSLGESGSAGRWRARAELMRKAIGARYLVADPTYGRIWTLDHSGWSHRSTVLGPLIFLADETGFAPEDDDPQWRPANAAAYRRLLDTYRPFGFYGQAMGYGQGFVTQSALLLDRMGDATQMLEWAAKEIHDPRGIGSDIVPEGCEIDPTGKFWYRVGDLGNGVQEAEIVKALRIVIGVDDTRPERVRLFPRMPYGWSEMAVEKYPVLYERAGKMATASLRYRLERFANGRIRIEIAADRDLGPIALRLGPFRKPPDASAERSGDSWWARFTVPVGPRTAVMEAGNR